MNLENESFGERVSVEVQHQIVLDEMELIKRKSCLIEDIFKVRLVLSVFDKKYSVKDGEYGSTFDELYGEDIGWLEDYQLHLTQKAYVFLVENHIINDTRREQDGN